MFEETSWKINWVYSLQRYEETLKETIYFYIRNLTPSIYLINKINLASQTTENLPKTASISTKRTDSFPD